MSKEETISKGLPVISSTASFNPLSVASDVEKINTNAPQETKRYQNKLIAETMRNPTIKEILGKWNNQ
jgi:hypothetical protein